MNGTNRGAYYDAIYLDSFGVEHIPKETKKKDCTSIWCVVIFVLDLLTYKRQNFARLYRFIFS